MRILPIARLLRNLKGEIPTYMRTFLPKEEAYKQLKELTGQDFGMDAQQWKIWIKAQQTKGVVFRPIVGLIFDARDVTAYRTGHIPGALLLPASPPTVFDIFYADVRAKLEADKDQPIAVCTTFV